MPSEFIDARNPAPPAAMHGDVFNGNLLVGGSDEFRVGLLIPMCGSAGIWGPSCIASAEVACKFLPHLTVIPTTLDGDSYDT